MGNMNHLTSLLKSFIEKGPAGCSCTVVRDGETVYEEGFGLADLELNKPITPDTIYRIYSLSKIITCTAALILYERGLFLLNDPLEEYLPEFKDPHIYKRNTNGEWTMVPAASSIRIKHLFSMTSGLTYGLLPGIKIKDDFLETARETGKILEDLNRRAAEGDKVSMRDFSKALAGVPLAFEPGAHRQYGLSHDVLGVLIEVLTGKTLGRFLQDEIFDPLGMKDTFFRIPDDKRDRLCSLYNRSDDGTMTKITRMDAGYQPEAVLEMGGQGLLSTLGDYSRFAQMLACGGELDGVRVLSANTIQLMATNHLGPAQMADFNIPQLAGYGYGLGVRVMIDPAAGGSNSSVGEFGWSGAAGNYVLIDPKLKLSAVYMQQMFPNFEAYHHPRLRSVIYGAL
ncbi:serine hydrolase domain-containing protein [Paenibacillus cremeus]|uniref:Beta-lactamase family protein n=1 Tax=Paenibacillus cremeus TaxID=2163881 RepID=A0A559JCZ2_9BACL|nr:serine hydrolase domain-containing protein [Paenibacillus cremeus]TVX97739.1 beta-lactamase family protein [Paenibacillus cremeus]